MALAKEGMPNSWAYPLSRWSLLSAFQSEAGCPLDDYTSMMGSKPARIGTGR